MHLMRWTEVVLANKALPRSINFWRPIENISEIVESKLFSSCYKLHHTMTISISITLLVNMICDTYGPLFEKKKKAAPDIQDPSTTPASRFSHATITNFAWKKKKKLNVLLAAVTSGSLSETSFLPKTIKLQYPTSKSQAPPSTEQSRDYHVHPRLGKEDSGFQKITAGVPPFVKSLELRFEVSMHIKEATLMALSYAPAAANLFTERRTRFFLLFKRKKLFCLIFSCGKFLFFSLAMILRLIMVSVLKIGV